jgi:putative transposase
VAVDALGNPLRILLGPGQQSDHVRAWELAEGLGCKALIADKGYDSQPFVDRLLAQGAEPVVPSRKTNKCRREYDRNLYKDRNKIERFFCRLKNFRRIATRYEKTACCFLAFVHLASTLIWLV